MTSAFKFALVIMLAVPTLITAADAAKSQKSAQATPRFPLRGVVVAVDAERAMLTVKHEAIPGVMRAMTMLFRVEPETLKSARAGQAITAMLSRRGDEWWLHEVKSAPEKTK